MGKYFNYQFDEVYLKRGAYYPKYFADTELEQNTLRKQLLESAGWKTGDCRWASSREVSRPNRRAPRW